MRRTHEAAAFAISVTVGAHYPDLVPRDLPSLALVGAALWFGALTPDIDRSRHLAARLAGAVWSGHRRGTHSLPGLAVFSGAVALSVGWLAPYLPFPIDPRLVAGAFALGMGSHLALDALTPQGVPLLWPGGWSCRLPLAALRIPTGGWLEQRLIFPVLLGLALWQTVALARRLLLSG